MRATIALAPWLLLLLPLLPGCSGDGDPAGPGPTQPAGSIELELRDPDATIASFGITALTLTATSLDDAAAAPVSTTLELGAVALPVTARLEGLAPGDWQLQVRYSDASGAELGGGEIELRVEEDQVTRADNLLVNAGSQVQVSWRTVIRGTIHFDGRPLPETTSTPIRISVIDNDGGGSLPERVVEYDPVSGQFTLSNVTFARVAIYVYVVENGGNANLPGNFFSYSLHDFRSDAAVDRDATVLEVARVVHLTSPTDIATDLHALDHFNTHSTPVNFAWEPIVEATRYQVRVDEYDLEPSFRVVGTVYSESITTNTVEVALPLLPAGHVYAVRVEAYGNAGRVGVFRRVYQSGIGSDYRFRVQ